MGMVGKLRPLRIFSTAKSSPSSPKAMTSASNLRPSAKVTVTVPPSETTWALVKTKPSELIIVPLPLVFSVSIETTAGLAFS